jgi:hypothetical protein
VTTKPKVYLGDSVYAVVADGMLTITTENGLGASNTIHLEPQVWHQLLQYVGGGE